MSHRSAPSRTTWVALAWLAGLLPGAAASGQRVAGQVLQLGWGEPVGGALVVLLDEQLAQVDSVFTDGAGAFVFTAVRAGTYQLQASAEGEFSTLSDPVRLGREDMSDVLLLMPSTLMTRAMECLGQADGRTRGVLVGVAYERTTRSPLPGATVRVEWTAEGDAREVEAIADASGRYHLCDVPGGVTLRARVIALGRMGASEPVEVEAGTLHRADLALSVASAADLPPRVEMVERRASDDEGGAVTGRLIDEDTGQPVTAAVVAVPQAEIETLTDNGGRFRLEKLNGAVHVVEIERLGYGEQTLSLEVREGVETVIEVRITARPVTLAGVSADARRPLLGVGLMDPKSSRIVAGADMAAYERRGASFESVVRERFPIIVQEGVYKVDNFTFRMTCMQSRRVSSFSDVAEQTDSIYDYPECRMVPVFVDDAPVANPGTFVDHVRLSDFESILYLAPTEVGMRYGLEGNSSGVLLLYTRGRGPFVDRARNVR